MKDSVLKTKKKVSKFINYSLYRQVEDLKRLKFIIDNIEKNGTNESNILDIGCGNGNISFQLANMGYNVTAIDVSRETVENAKAIHNHANITYEIKSVEKFAPSVKFDIIICSEVLEHLPYSFEVLQKIISFLSIGGCIIVTVPNGYGPRELLVTRPMQYLSSNDGSFTYKILNRLKRCMGYTGMTIQSQSHNLQHIQFFKLADIHSYAEVLGMDVISEGASNFLEKVFPFSLLAKRFILLQKIDCKIADLIPLQWSSGFFFVLKKR